MKKKVILFSVIFSFTLVACQQGGNEIHLSEANADFIPDATSPSIPTVQILALPQVDPRAISFDFSDRVCKAAWSNNGEYLPCPGDLNDIRGGYANRLDSFKINGDVQVEVPALLTIPAQSDSQFAGLFGKYPPYTVQEGDMFKTKLACRNEVKGCDATSSLEYYTADNQVEQVSGAKWQVNYDPSGGLQEVEISLDELAGRTLQFLLVVRDNGDPLEDYVIWIQPHIAKNPENETSQQEESEENQSVLVSGTVDMASAPPYLYDDHPPGSDVVVVLSNAGAPQWYWVSTRGTHPFFQLEVVPGSYYVHAYAPGVGEASYVTGAYTGSDPSCGNPLAVLSALPGDDVVENVLINDWNFACDVKADRFEKPEGVPLP